MECDVSLDFPDYLMDVSIQDGHGAKAAQLGQQLFRIAGPPAPGLVDAPERHVGEHDQWSAVGTTLQVGRQPIDLLAAQSAEATRLELQDVDQGDKVHARMVEAVVAPVVRGFAEPIEVFRDLLVRHVVLTRYGVHLGSAQPGQHLPGQVEFRGLRQMGDIAGVKDQCGLLAHPVDEVDCLRERRVDVGIGVLAEADVGVTDLHEQRFPGFRSRFRVRRRDGQIDGREDSARQGEQGTGAAEGHAFQGSATGMERVIFRHRLLRRVGFLRKRTRTKVTLFPRAEILQQAYQSGELRPVGVRDGAVTQISHFPTSDVVTASACSLRHAAFTRRPAEYIDEVRAVLVNDDRRTLVVEVIRTPAEEPIALLGEVRDGRGDIGMACEPGLHGVAIGGDHIDQMRGHQRAHMRAHELIEERIRRAGEQVNRNPCHERSAAQAAAGSQPEWPAAPARGTPSPGSGTRICAFGFLIECAGNPSPQLGRSHGVSQVLTHSGAHAFEILKLVAALGAVLRMPLDLRRGDRVHLAIEVSLHTH